MRRGDDINLIEHNRKTKSISDKLDAYLEGKDWGTS